MILTWSLSAGCSGSHSLPVFVWSLAEFVGSPRYDLFCFSEPVLFPVSGFGFQWIFVFRVLRWCGEWVCVEFEFGLWLVVFLAFVGF